MNFKGALDSRTSRLMMLGFGFSICLLFAPIASQANTATVDTATKYQTIDGFGWHGVMDLYWNVGPFYNDAWVKLVIDTLGLTIDRNEFYPDNNVTFTTKQKAALLALNAEATAKNEPLRLWIAIWSPPANWKSGGSTNGGELLASHYADYGNYLANAALMYQTAGIPLYGISPQNEPSYEDGSYNTTGYSGATYDSMFGVVAPIIKASCPDTKMIGPEICCVDAEVSSAEWSSTFLNDSRVKSNLDIFAYHNYKDPAASTTTSTESKIHTLSAGKSFHVWQTETGFTSSDMATCVKQAQQIHNDLTIAYVNGWCYWQGCGDDADNNFSVVIHSNAVGTIGTITKRFYILRHYFRFIRPGAQRIKITPSTADANLLVSAFKRTAESGGENWAIVCVNLDGSASKSISLAGVGLPAQFDVYQTTATLNCAKLSPMAGSDSLTLPAQSVTTLVFGDFHGGVKEAVVNEGIHSNVAAGSLPVRLTHSTNAITISYDVATPSAVRIDIVGTDGRTIGNVVRNPLTSRGAYRATWQPAGTLGAGVYIVKTSIGGATVSIPCALTK